jgi:predicted ATPase
LGYPDQSRARSREIFQLVQEELSHPFSLAYTLSLGSWPYLFRREIQALLERTETAIALAREHRFPLWHGEGLVLQGWALTEQGQAEIGLAETRQGLDKVLSTGAEMFHPQNLALLAEAYGKAGQTEAALTTLAEALAVSKKLRECWWDAEIYRLRGELLQTADRRRMKAELSSEAYFLKAIETAQRQKAKSLELRAVMSLSRLWRFESPGKKEEARRMLAEIYGWFTEGFDTADLQEAKALFEALS